MNFLKLIIHKIAHLFGWNYGHVVSWREGDQIYISFKCQHCGKVELPGNKFPINEKEPDYDDTNS